MIDKKELQSAISNTKKTKEDRSLKYLYYDETGCGHDKLDDDKTCAIKMYSSAVSIFKVKLDRHKKLYNPLEKDNFRYTLSADDKTTRDKKFKLRQVDEKAFNYYLAFLKNRHDSQLILAEREI